MLAASAAAWNRGDLDGFLADYAEDATYVGSRGLVRGAESIRALYERGYWSGGVPRDLLRFELLDVRITGPGAATAVGRYLLEDRDSGQRTGTGLFTLVLTREGGAWKILHDHSSAEPAG